MDFSEIQQGPQKFDRENSDKKYPAERPKSTGSWIIFTDKSRILLITLLQNVRNKKANIEIIVSLLDKLATSGLIKLLSGVILIV